MKVSKIIRYPLLLVIAFAYFAVIPRSALVFEEGWHTFFWDSHYVKEAISRNGVVEVVRDWLLQFYANEWMGTAVLTLIVCVLMMVLMLVLGKRVKAWSAFCVTVVLELVCMVGMSTWMSEMSVQYCMGLQLGSSNERFVRLSNEMREGNWDEVVNISKEERPVVNLLHQNCLNAALAEKGMLTDHLTDEPCIDIRSIYVDEITSPVIASLLSDIYYSMGHIAQAQRYAFELNEKLDNLSPRLLQRLVQTNIIYGQYAVAEKYLEVLRKAAFYDEWCKHYSAMLYDDKTVEADEEMGLKRKCLFADNRFSGIYGLDDDLLHIARNTRGTKQSEVTLQYLDALYRLAGYEKEYKAMKKEFGR